MFSSSKQYLQYFTILLSMRAFKCLLKSDLHQKPRSFHACHLPVSLLYSCIACRFILQRQCKYSTLMHVVACNYVHATTYDLISKPCYTYSRKTKETWILALLFNNSDITSPTSQDVNQFRSTTTGGTEWLLPHSQASAFFFCSVCYNTRKQKTSMISCN